MVGAKPNVMRYFCTYFDHRYLPRGLALYSSLQQHCPAFELWVLAMDAECSSSLRSLNLPGIRVVDLEMLEKKDAALLIAKGNRSLIEYYFTCTASWLLYVLESCSEADLVTYLDADLYFFSNAEPIFQEMADQSIAIIEHRFADDMKHLEIYGIYNVGWLSFRRDQNSQKCLEWWRERCLEWCYDRLEDGRFADQKYLDEWPARFESVCIIKHNGAGLGPWNVSRLQLTRSNSSILVNSDPLIFFHFHSLKVIRPYLFEHGLAAFKGNMTNILKSAVYGPYLKRLKSWMSVIGKGSNGMRRTTANSGLISQLMRNQMLLALGPMLVELDLPRLMKRS